MNIASLVAVTDIRSLVRFISLSIRGHDRPQCGYRSRDDDKIRFQGPPRSKMGHGISDVRFCCDRLQLNGFDN